jgi:hypothetical protein
VARQAGGTIQAAGSIGGTRSQEYSVIMSGSLCLGLLATTDVGYKFAGWTGHCSRDMASYSLPLTGPRTCGATFSPSK